MASGVDSVTRAVRGNLSTILGCFLVAPRRRPQFTVTHSSRQEEKTTGTLLLEFLFMRKAKAFPGSSSHGPELLLRVIPQLCRRLGKQAFAFPVFTV